MYNNYMSGAHAFCVAMQIHRGSDPAFAATETILDLGDDAEVMPASELARYLGAAGLPVRVSVVPEGLRQAWCERQYRRGWTVLALVRPSDDAARQRWAVVWRTDSSRFRLAECVDEGEWAGWESTAERYMVGDYVVVEEDPGPNRTVLATVAAPH